ncbi:MAG: hypothetical protein ACF8NJ_06360 [Phycisphaerales bacterium JB038]
MRKRIAAIRLPLLLAVAAVVLGLQSVRYRTARSEALSAVAFAERIAADAARLTRLRDQQRTGQAQADLDGDVVSIGAALLEESAIPFSSVGSITADPADSVLGSGTDGQPSLRISLRRISLPRLGAFLKKWSESQGEWKMQSIRLTKSSQRSTEAGLSYSVELQFALCHVGGSQ